MADHAIKVVVSGAAGRMGSTVVEAVEAADGMEVAAKADPEPVSYTHLTLPTICSV